MSRNTPRIALIVVVGLVLIGTALLLSKNHSKNKKQASLPEAAVLAADANGAITETDDGVIHGYTRGGKEIWSQSPQFINLPGKGKTLMISNARCVGACPAAFTNNAAGGRNVVLAYGFGGSAEAQEPGAPLDESNVVVRGAVDAQTVLIRTGSGKRASYSFVTPPVNGAKSRPVSPEIPIKPATLVNAAASDDGSKVLVAEATGAAGDTDLKIRWFEHAGGKMQQVGKPVTAKRADTCFPGNGEVAAVNSPENFYVDFGGGNKRVLPLDEIGGGCTFSPDGVTIASTNKQTPTQLRLTHFTLDGKQVWTRTFDKSAGFNSHFGDNPLYQVVTPDATMMLAANNGKTVQSKSGAQAAFAAGRGVFVRALNDGTPVWVK